MFKSFFKKKFTKKSRLKKKSTAKDIVPEHLKCNHKMVVDESGMIMPIDTLVRNT